MPSPDHQEDEEEDDFLGSETDADDEDDESGDSRLSGLPSIRLEDANQDALYQSMAQLAVQDLCHAMVTMSHLYQETIAKSLDGSDASVSQISDNEESRLDMLRASNEFKQAVDIAERLYDTANSQLAFFAGLLDRREVHAAITSTTPGDMAAHRLIQLFLADVWKLLADNLEEDFDAPDAHYDIQQTERSSSNAQPSEVEATTTEKGEASVPTPSGLAEPFQLRDQGKMSLNAILCDQPSESTGTTTGVHIESTDPVPELKDTKVTLEPWMIEATPTVVKAKTKKNKRKKKATPRNNDVEAPDPVSEKSKDLPRSLHSGLKASNSVTSVLTSDESAPEARFKSPFATKNIFEQLKLVEDAKQAARPSDSSAPADEDKARGGKQELVQKQIDVNNKPPSQHVDLNSKPEAPPASKATGLQTEVIDSWADCEVEDPPKPPSNSVKSVASDVSEINKPSKDADPRKLNSPSNLVSPFPLQVENNQSLSGQRLQSSARGPSTKNQIAVNGAGTSAVSQTNGGSLSSGRLPFPPGLGFRNQSPNPNSLYNRGLSFKDIREGASIEVHPTKGTECVVLREPRERPDYPCMLFAAG